MAANPDTAEGLIEESQHLGHHPTREQAVVQALEEYVWHRRQLEIRELYGTIDFDPEYDYKKHRMMR